MDKYMVHSPQLYRLTSLQIGDIQSYLSALYVLVNREKMVFFVDNGPWCSPIQRSRSVELWQLMVTQSRISPFANRSQRCEVMERINKQTGDEIHGKINDLRRKLFMNKESKLLRLNLGNFWHRLSIFQNRLSRHELSHLLHGCVTFELEWAHVRGINYLNELQTDTCVALEMKYMVKREFHDFQEALSYYKVDFRAESSIADITSSTNKTINSQSVEDTRLSPSTPFCNESVLSRQKEELLVCTSDSDSESDYKFFDAEYSSSLEITCSWDTCRDMAFEKRVEKDYEHAYFDAAECQGHTNVKEEEMCDATYDCDVSDDASSSCSLQDSYSDYKDILLVFRFSDLILPLALQNVITADQRLLKMLESGLPSWAIFLQSYPVFSKLYRPWMRPLAKAMYILVSIITVIIGFYDLYKNVPVLKATAARICGPLFDWIEHWEMISRIKYLGTVLFLQNWEKAFRWLLLVIRTAKNLMKPIMIPLKELSEIFGPVGGYLSESAYEVISLIWMTFSTIFEYLNDFVQLIVWPFVLLLSTVWKLVVILVYPVISMLWNLVTLPFQLIMLLVDIIVALFGSLYTFSQSAWTVFSQFGQLLYTTAPQRTSSSTWRVLWNEIFSKVFHAVKSIVNVFIAFFTTCNRHRLSIYNHTTDFISQLMRLGKHAHSRVADTCRRVPFTRKEDFQSKCLVKATQFSVSSGNNRNGNGSNRYLACQQCSGSFTIFSSLH